MKCTRLSLSELLAFPIAKSIVGYEDESKNGGAGTDGNGDGTPKDPPASSASSEGDKPKGDPEKKIAALEEEKNRHHELRQKEKQRADDLEQKLKDLMEKDLPEQDKMRKRIAELEEAQTTSSATVQSLAVENAFLKVNDVVWHNPTRALASVDLTGLEVDKDGKVDTAELKRRIAKLAKDEPYLVKQSEGDENGKPPPKSGAPPKGNDPGARPDREKLAAKYPALRSH